MDLIVGQKYLIENTPVKLIDMDFPIVTVFLLDQNGNVIMNETPNKNKEEESLIMNITNSTIKIIAK